MSPATVDLGRAVFLLPSLTTNELGKEGALASSKLFNCASDDLKKKRKWK